MSFINGSHINASSALKAFSLVRRTSLYISALKRFCLESAIYVLASFFLPIGSLLVWATPEKFVEIPKECPEILIESSYATEKNFTGTVVVGYKRVTAYTSEATMEALCKIQKTLDGSGLVLKIFDAYRPVRAVRFFQLWATQTEDRPDLKALYYPHHTREELFKIGYIATRSSHSRGSAVDLTLVDVKSGKELDMGTRFDFFHESSHTNSSLITEEQKKNRLKLLNLMEAHGFKNFEKEWWHFSLKKEPFPDTYFDFEVE